MAVGTQEKGTEFRGRQLAVGTNVLVATVLVIAIVAVLQWGGYRFGGKADWTSSSVNSLSEGTENLLGSLDQKVRITSAYFQTDLENEDQKKFRRAVNDLLDLYQSQNRSKIEVDRFNPLQDHDKRKALLDRLSAKPRFQEQSAGHRALIDAFNNEVLPEATALLTSELETLANLGDSLGGPGGAILGQIQALLRAKQRELGSVKEDIDAALDSDIPRYSAVATALRSLYTGLSQAFKNIGEAGQEVATNAGGLLPGQQEYLAGAKQRYQSLTERLDEQVTGCDDLPRLDLEEVVRKLGPGTNPVLVETEQDAKVLTFSDVWPPLDPNMPSASMAFKDRAFRGEEKVSSAILQLTSPEKTAVVFAKFGGPPLFFGGFMPGQPPAPYARVKAHLEDLNFEVREWDLSRETDPPEIDPAPVKTIYIVLKPQSPQPNPMMQQQQPTFGEEQRRAVIDAVGKSGRALFVAGWYHGRGPMPSTYEYGRYLTENWGISADTGVLLLQAVPIGPGKFRFGRTAALMTDAAFADHAIVRSLSVQPAVFPNVSPLELADEPPEGVELQELARCDRREGLWGARNIQSYIEQSRNEYVVKAEGDAEGPFTLAAVASKGDAKIVVAGARDFFSDDAAFAVEAVLTAEGLTLRSRNPGNLTMLVNSLHWLNDKEEIMNLGSPIDVSTLEIAKGPTLSFLQVLVGGIWPLLAVVCGGVVWYVRRR